MKITNFLADTKLQYQVSDSREKIERFPDHVTFRAGGFKDSAGTHYARAKLSYAFPTERRIILRTVIELPSNFYEIHKASLKLIAAGTESPYQRTGLWIDSDGYPRLQAEIKGQLLRKLWQGTKKLPTGRCLVRLLIIPSAIEGQGIVRLSVNSVKWGESRAPNMLDKSHAQINRIVWGIDGAADQDSGDPLSLTIWRIEIR